jgi:hypothetical protein|tara:strand:+ start:927 stop:1319 length:393 start_codon:yes stop_codon:yes gene_type:complete
MYSKEDLFEQALEGNIIKFEKLSSISLINIGVKISKYASKIEILNCSKSGDYYQELTEYEYNIFYKNGWEKGCRLLALNNCKRKVELIQEKMKTEVNTRKNDKFIKNLKTKRDAIMKKYSYHANKLTKLN